MKTQFTNAVGLMTGKIKNNTSIYCSKNQFTIFLNGELILRGTAEGETNEELVFRRAKEVLEQLKFGEFPIEEFQQRFDSFIKS